MSMKHAPIPKLIKIKAMEMNLTQTDLARIISARTGKHMSPKRLNDMIHGLRQGEWLKYHFHVAEILKMPAREIRDVTANPPD